MAQTSPVKGLKEKAPQCKGKASAISAVELSTVETENTYMLAASLSLFHCPLAALHSLMFIPFSVDSDNDNDTQRCPSNNVKGLAGLTGMSVGVMTPRKRIC